MPPVTPVTKHKALLIEDNPGDVRLIRLHLADAPHAPFELVHADKLSAGLERLAAGDIDLVLLDMSLPDSFGLDTFKRAHAAAPQVPIIVLSGLDDESVAVQTVQLGAQDYLVKGQMDNRLLVHAMRYAIERKRAEELLARERDLFHTLLDNLPDRIFFKDERSRFLRVNRALSDRFKLGHPREVVGRTDFDFFAATHAQPAYDDEQQIMRTGEPLVGKVENETLPDGTTTWVLTSKLPLRDKTGRIAGTFGISRDITALKKTEAALSAERNLLRNLIDNLPDYIYVEDAACRFVIDNIAHRQFLGVTRDADIAGKTLADFFSLELATNFAADDQLILRSGKPLVNREERVVDHAGNQRWHSTTKVPLRDDDGQINGLVGISRDITETKEAEEKLQEANRELARSQEKLLKVFGDLQKSHEELKAAQSQLIQAEKMQSVGRLAAGVAHEVKNPLAILGMGIEYLAGKLAQSDSTVTLTLTDMADAVQRADAIILGLLDFSAHRDLDSKSEDVSAIVEQALGLVKHSLGGANAPIRVHKELAPDLPPVWLDRNKIIQVLVNVLTNAAHAMPEGGTLTVRTQARQLQPDEIDRDDGSRLADRFRAGDTVVVTQVEDTGHGIPPERLTRIFDPFFTTKPTGQGTGLGLTVSKKIVELHGGTITIQNRKEGGVRVTLLLKA